jgi:hypothetical protein
LSAIGGFIAQVKFPAYSPYLAEGILNIKGESQTFEFPIRDNAANFFFDVNLSGPAEMTGYVYSTSGAWESPFTLYKAAPKLYAGMPPRGKYMLSLDPTNAPATNAYAVASVAESGNVAVSGMLPDGATFSESAHLSTNGTWPLFVMPSGYGKNGMLIGWENWQTNGAGSFNGQLYWYKGSDIGKYYTGGVDTNVTAVGTNYVAPAVGSYSIVFYESTNSAPITNALTVTRLGGPFEAGKSTTDKLAISITPNGVLSGHFIGPTDTKPAQFHGAFFSQAQGGSGFILESDGQMGYFLLQEDSSQ